MPEISQYVSRVLFATSEYSTSGWKAANLIGAPSEERAYGDNPNAWCPASDRDDQRLELEFDEAVFVRRLNVYENFNGGAVSKIEAYRSDTGAYELVWRSDVTRAHDHYNVFSPAFAPTLFVSSRVRLTLSLSNRQRFPEIEAVQLVGASLDVDVPAPSIEQDMAQLMRNNYYSDMSVNVKSIIRTSSGEEFNQPFKLHRSILYVRCIDFFDFLRDNKYKLASINNLEFELVAEFVYTDTLNDKLVKKIVAHARSTELGTTDADNDLDANKSLLASPTPAEDNDDDDDDDDDEDDEDDEDEEDDEQDKGRAASASMSKQEILNDYEAMKALRLSSPPAANNWLLTLNKLIRYAYRFHLKRLAKMLTNYMLVSFLSVENALAVLMDANEGVDASAMNNQMPLDVKFKLDEVDAMVLAYVRLHIKKIVKTPRFATLPKDAIIRIVSAL